MMYTVHLAGHMGKKYGKSTKLAAANLYQLMSGLISRFGPQFKEDVRTGKWHFINGSKKVGNDFSEDDLKNGRALKNKTVHLVPAVEGDSAVFRVVVGIILIIVGVYFEQPWLVNMGVAMALGGVVEMLTKPKTKGPDQPQDDKGSAIYNYAQNVTSQGGPIPLAYGKRIQRISSVLITTDFSADEII
jgi:predicted phage tail protein